jgi:hypothetical protein
MMALCATCNFAQHVAIDDMLRAGRSARSIALAFASQDGPSRYSVDRHLAHRHVAGMPAQTFGGAPKAVRRAPRGDDDPVAILREAMGFLRAMDPTKLSPAVLVARLDALRKAAESIAKIEPPRRNQDLIVDEILDMNNGFLREAQAIAFLEMEPYPDLRERLTARLKALASRKQDHGSQEDQEP